MCEPASIADIQTPCKSHTTVHDQNFAVVAKVGIGKVDRHAGGQKSLHSHALLREQSDDRGKRVAGPDAIHEHPHFNASLHCASECFREYVSRAVVVEDIRCQPDTASGSVNRSEHPRIRFVATEQRFDRVAIDERTVGDAGNEHLQRPQGPSVGADGLSQAVVVWHSAAEFLRDPQLTRSEVTGPRTDPIDTQHGIRNGPKDRREPDQSHPPDGGASISFGENCVG